MSQYPRNDVGSFVMNVYHGLVRYGTVRTKRIAKDGWAYFTVEWHNDEDYKEAIAWRAALTVGDDHTLEEYRGDSLTLISNPRRLSLAVDAHYHFLALPTRLKVKIS